MRPDQSVPNIKPAVIKENKLSRRLNPIFGDNIAEREIYKQFLKGQSFLTKTLN